MKKGRPQGRKDSYHRPRKNYKGGKRGRRVKNTYRYFRRWELLRIRNAQKSGELLLYIDEAEIYRRYLLKEWSVSVGFKGRMLRKAETAINRKIENLP